MPSSISNFDQTKLTRTIPNKNWFQLLIITAFFLILFIIVWEYYARVRGFEVSIDDNYDLWANARSKINSDPKQIVMLGSSQVLLDFNLELFTQTLGTKPIQLASVAANPFIYLDDIANKTNFQGTIIIGIDFRLSDAKGGIQDIRAKKNLDYYYNWNISQKIAFYLGLLLDTNFAFIGQDKVKAKYLLKHFRSKDNLADAPFLFRIINLDRQANMAHKLATDKKYQMEVKNFSMPPSREKILKPKESQFQIKPESINNFIVQLKPSVDKIRSRGGKVILVQLPITGNLKIMYDVLLPKQNFWNRVVNESNANIFIHYENYPTLNGFNCPDWVHLTVNDAKIFTQNFLNILTNSKYK